MSFICPLCKQPGIDSFKASPLDKRDSKPVAYHKCRTCEVLYLSDEVTAALQQVDYSESGYYSVKEARFPRLIRFFMDLVYGFRLHLVQQVAGNLKGKTILDIGCGKGQFLNLARSCGANISGVEPTKRSYEAAAALLGSAVKNEEMKVGLFPASSVDVVTMWHVFEHLPNPIDMLGLCHTVLRDDGVLVLAVPNFKSWIAMLGEAVWFNLDPPRHIIHYSPMSLASLLKKNGFEVVRINCYYPELTFFSALQTFLNKLPITPNFLFNFLKRNKAAMPISKMRYYWDMLLTGAAGLFVMPLVVLLVSLASFVHKSDCITLSARKNGTVEPPES